jgi:Zn-dependent oligopeptidase
MKFNPKLLNKVYSRALDKTNLQRMNPLLAPYNSIFETHPFEEIKTEHFEPAIREAIEIAKTEIDALTANEKEANFENTIVALERSGKLVSRVSSVFFNLNSAETNDAIQAAARTISPMLSAYGNDIMLNADLFKRVKAVYDKRDALSLNPEEAMLLDKTYQSFARNGANLDGKDQKRLREIDQELSTLSLSFGEHVLADTNDFKLIVEDAADLSGLPETVKETAHETANELGMADKWVFTLHYPSYIPFVTYAENRKLRETITRAFGSRSNKAGETDNRGIVQQIANLRHERANLLGFETHAHYVLQQRMAEEPEKVQRFSDNLLTPAKPAGEKDVEEVSAYAKELDGLEKLEKWDFAYYSEKLKQAKYEIDDERLKPYFKLENVIDGAFKVAEKLYGIHFHLRNDIQKYHADVQTYEVKDKDGKHLAVFYADFFPRKGKRNGAWMTSYRDQEKVGGVDNRPHISIVCNFTKPTASTPSLLTFQEVTTLFHEFGHALHGILANGTYASLSGTNVYWDFVELPSQVMENWCYEKECLDLFAKHYETNEPIPADLVERLKKSSTFMEGYATVRQIGLGRLDMAWHAVDPQEIEDTNAYEKEVLAQTELLPWIEGSSTSCSFSHIFQGGYSSGYYSYKWAEVLDADAFEYFKENGIFNTEIAAKFRKLLAAGGSEHPMTLYKVFRGKEPDEKALLRRAGLI